MQELLPGEAPQPARGQTADVLPRLRLTDRRLPVALALSFVGGILSSLAFPPVAAWPLAFVAPALLLIGLRDAAPGRGFALGLVYGLVGFGLTLSWLQLFGTLAWSALTVLAAASVALFGACLPLVRRSGHPLLNALGAAALWTSIDWLRGLWPLGGFTWGSLGASQVANTVTVRLAVVAGVFGVTFAVAFAAALFAEAPGMQRSTRLAAIGLAVIAILGPAAIPFADAAGREIDVAAIQVDFLEGVARGSREEGDIAVTRLNLDLHARLREDPPDLAVWGESALDPGSLSILDEVRSAIEDVGSPVLSGATSADIRSGDGSALFNQAVVFDGGGAVVDVYRKTHLVPYGEYIPWKPIVGWVSALEQIAYELTPGERLHTLRAPGLPRFGTPICFENSFPALDRELVRQGAEFLVVLTNNASYDRTAASAQHLQMSRIRAIEDGRWIVHAAVSGISAFIDPAGRVYDETGLFEPAVIRRTIRASSEWTWSVRLGDWVPILSVVIVAGLAAVPRRRRFGRPDPGSLVGDVRTLVILPTYDEAATIQGVVAGVLEHPGVEALVVDDSSPDGTATVVRGLMAGEPRLRLVERPGRAGLASAYEEGFRRALLEGYDLIVEMDSDLSHDPVELGALLAAARDRFHLVVGSRYVPGGSVTNNWSRMRLALSKTGNTYARLMLGLPVHDATSGYRVYRRELLRDLVTEPFHADGYGFQVELVMRSWLRGWSIGEVPITFREREHGHSKLSRRIVVEALWLVTRWGIALRAFGRPYQGGPPAG
jgi:apolipoprotein N-acyltransferase